MNINSLKKAAIIWISLLCILQLSGCGFAPKKLRQDGPPSIDFDASKIPDAVPKAEPLSRTGNKDYVVLGRHYKVLKSSKGYSKRGLASWYGTMFHGQYTSSRELYSLYDMTAASRELPLPTYVEVTNLDNQKKIIVKVNDRGPFHCDRILDLSYAAAKKLGFANRGTALVQVTAIDPNTWQNVISTPDPYYLQAGAFKMLANAKTLAERITKLTDKHVHIAHNTPDLYLVKIGPLMNRDQSNFIKNQLAESGIQTMIINKT